MRFPTVQPSARAKGGARSTSRLGTSHVRGGGATPSCWSRTLTALPYARAKGPAAPSRRHSLRVRRGAMPTSRRGSPILLPSARAMQASHPARGRQRRYAIVLVVDTHSTATSAGERASSTSSLHISRVRCGAMPTCRRCSLILPPSARATAPPAPAGLSFLTSAAAPCHRAGCGLRRRCRQRVQEKGPAASAGLTSLTCAAAPCGRAGGVRPRGRLQRVRNPLGRGSALPSCRLRRWRVWRHGAPKVP